jgi:hypothetical protein
MRSLALVGQVLLYIQVDRMIIRLDGENGIVQLGFTACLRSAGIEYC